MSSTSIRRDFKETDFEATKALIVWNALVEPGDRVASQLIHHLGPIGALQAFAERRDLGPEYRQAYERWIPRYSANLAEMKISLAKKHDLKLLLPNDELWPASLNDLGAHAPLLIWYRGNCELFRTVDKSVGVVGSRNASNYGQRVTSDLVSMVVAEKAAVVSGGALGIDTVAHRVALGCQGSTVAIMAGSLDLPYPAANFDLFNEIAHSGLLISEMSPGSNPTRWRFLQRNRLIAAVSKCIVVTEAGLRSGSINTVNHAGELGRPVFAIPGPITSPSSAGCNRLIIEQKAQLLMDVDDLPNELGWRDSQSDLQQGLGVLELRALDALNRRPQEFQDVLGVSGLTATELRIALGGLKMNGLATNDKGGLWKRN